MRIENITQAVEHNRYIAMTGRRVLTAIHRDSLIHYDISGADNDIDEVVNKIAYELGVGSNYTFRGKIVYIDYNRVIVEIV